MADLREFARAALAQTDDQLAADCAWQQAVVGPKQTPVLRVRHHATGLEVEVEPRKTEEQTRFIALLYLRNRCYDMLRARGK